MGCCAQYSHHLRLCRCRTCDTNRRRYNCQFVNGWYQAYQCQQRQSPDSVHLRHRWWYPDGGQPYECSIYSYFHIACRLYVQCPDAGRKRQYYTDNRSDWSGYQCAGGYLQPRNHALWQQTEYNSSAGCDSGCIRHRCRHGDTRQRYFVQLGN